jgi:pilus assembly protein CpaF
LPGPAPAKERPDAAASRAPVVEAGRSPIPSTGLGAPLISAPSPSMRTVDTASASSPPLVPSSVDSRHTEAYYETKSMVFGALIEAIDLAQLAKLDADSAREEIRDIVNEIIAIKAIVLSISEQEELLDDICKHVQGPEMSTFTAISAGL